MERKEIEQKAFDHFQPGLKRNELMSPIVRRNNFYEA